MRAFQMKSDLGFFGQGKRGGNECNGDVSTVADTVTFVTRFPPMLNIELNSCAFPLVQEE